MKFTLNDFFKKEYGADVVRLSNIFSDIKKPFEMAYFHVDCGETTTEHHHSEKEIFICLFGEGTTYLDDLKFDIKSNDIWFVNSDQKHKILNHSDSRLTLMSIWWD